MTLKKESRKKKKKVLEPEYFHRGVLGLVGFTRLLKKFTSFLKNLFKNRALFFNDMKIYILLMLI